MKILVLGSGGREHAIVRALLRDPSVREVHAAPGNAGIALDVPVHPVDATDATTVTELAGELAADLVVVGPEAPLAAGVSDALREAGFTVFGPSRAAAELEASKSFAKDVMAQAGVPTAAAHSCATAEEAAAALDEFGAPYVVKDDGLAAGKGVVVTSDRDEALAHAQACFAAHGTVVIEEYLDGPEVSLFVLSDGTNAVPLAPAQDFKRIGDADTGPNTGGMGAYTPLDWLPEGFVDEVMDQVARPVIATMADRGTTFAGVLYCGLALTSRGIRVIEFNVRFGDPETQAVLARLRTPLGRLLMDAATGCLAGVRRLEWSDEYAVDVVVAAEGYPEAPVQGGAVTGVEDAEALQGVSVLHAGTGPGPDGGLVAAGGRVLAVVGLGQTLAAARERAYAGVERITLPGSRHRTDIGLKAERGEITVPAGEAL
ncbi:MULTISPECIES: phosphoribosylamine--glycine ligase [Citricoccus]|uniref:phosphoribosylamine--glycine ligase n=1 Tax=Citricoccus TaxID=169133 RepID=UPI00048A5A75|nr:phosphoribosylamine--glycine ligase [Citricoccus sp. CH26A]